VDERAFGNSRSRELGHVVIGAGMPARVRRLPFVTNGARHVTLIGSAL